MASKRMFCLDVVGTDKFCDMPSTSQSLYFHLGMRADDDGFVSNPKQITKIVNCSSDDLKILVSKGFIIPFDSGIVVITEWLVNNNKIKPDRYKPTRYIKEFNSLAIENSRYLIGTITETLWNQCGTIAEPQSRVDKNRVDKSRLEINTVCSEHKELAPSQPPVIELPLNDKTKYGVQKKDYDKWCELYPAVDVIQELRKMYGWLDSNPTKRKTKRGIARFITSWLSREQDKGGTSYKKVENAEAEEPRKRPSYYEGRDFSNYKPEIDIFAQEGE